MPLKIRILITSLLLTPWSLSYCIWAIHFSHYFSRYPQYRQPNVKLQEHNHHQLLLQNNRYEVSKSRAHQQPFPKSIYKAAEPKRPGQKAGPSSPQERHDTANVLPRHTASS